MFEEVTIGECRLILGDCREVLPLLPPVDLVLTDPPYGIGADKGAGKSAAKWSEFTGENRWDEAPPPQWLLGLMLDISRFQIIWGGNYYGLPPTKCWLLWDKETAGITTFADAEVAWTNLDKAMRLKRHLWSGPYMKIKEERQHPTQKPLAIIEWCLEQAPGVATVCDPFMGSGTTGVACARMGLRFTGIERERKYFDIACRRIEQAYAQPRLFEDAKVGAGDTAVQGDMLLPANAKVSGVPHHGTERE